MVGVDGRRIRANLACKLADDGLDYNFWSAGATPGRSGAKCRNGRRGGGPPRPPNGWRSAAGANVHLGFSLLTLFPGRSGGTETYSRALIREYASGHGPEEVTLLINRHAVTAIDPEGLRLHHVRSYKPGDSAPSRLAGMTAAYLMPGRSARDVPAGIDVMHYPVTVTIPATAGATVVSLHDVLHHELPQLFSRGERLFRKVAYDRGARGADMVVTLSEYSREGIVSRLGIDPDRVVAIPCAPDHDLFQTEPSPRDDELKLPGRYLIYPANLWPHKNHARLLSAFAALDDEDLHLVLTGSTYGQSLPARGHPRVHHLGHVPFSDLPTLYRRATALVFPSLFEGFGMPVLEAMACGTPVAATGHGAIAETCGDAALLFDPEDEDAMEDAMRRVATDADLRRDLARRGLRRAAAYHWSAIADAHLAVYRRALERA
jgi:glycosyltransferase involved in cell wall biosynthesis